MFYFDLKTIFEFIVTLVNVSIAQWSFATSFSTLRYLFMLNFDLKVNSVKIIWLHHFVAGMRMHV